MRVILVAWGGIEPPTQGFSIFLEINWNRALSHILIYKSQKFQVITTLSKPVSFNIL